MPNFKFGEEVEFLYSSMQPPKVYVYVGPHGNTGEHIIYDPSDGEAYKTTRPGNYRRRVPRKGELWAKESVGGPATSRSLVVHADEHFVVYTGNWERKLGAPQPVGNLFAASRTGDFVSTRKLYEAVPSDGDL